MRQRDEADGYYNLIACMSANRHTDGSICPVHERDQL